VSGPRNRRGFERGRARRAQIEAILAQHPPLARPLTAREILARLTCQPLPSERTVQWHMQEIRDAAAQSLRPAQFIAD
jgi:hypothetical protein